MTSASRHSSSNEVERIRRQRATLAEFGAHALGNDDLPSLLQEATARVSDAIEVDLVKAMQLVDDGRTLLIVAGVNWRPGVVGHATMSADESTPGGYALAHDAPVISRDLSLEDRFTVPDLLVSHGVQSMINVVIKGKEGPFGILEVDAHEKCDFDDDDVNFLQNYANLLAGAIDRLSAQKKLTQAAARNEMLARELQHRVKNILAMVRALSRQTLAKSRSLEGYAQAFEGRIAALARTQNLLTVSQAGLISLRALAEEELEAHGAEKGRTVSLEGPDLLLPARAAQVLGLIFHELATNAVKHGALSQAQGGRIALSWNADSERIQLRWHESGVKLADREPPKGAGTGIILETLPYMLGGTSQLNFHADGVECLLEFPVPEETEELGRGA